MKVEAQMEVEKERIGGGVRSGGKRIVNSLYPLYLSRFHKEPILIDLGPLILPLPHHRPLRYM